MLASDRSRERRGQSSGPPEFAATRWSIVLSARSNNSPASAIALETLCRNYWRPLYAFVRRQGRSSHDAQDLTQAFFARLLEKDFLEDVSPTHGKFRSFLLAALKHFLANEWDKARAQRRGGGQAVISLDCELEENSRSFESTEIPPDAAFERRWAVTLLERVLDRLREEYILDGKKEVYEQLKHALTGEQAMSHEEAARKLGSSEGAVKVAAHRLRRRYRELLRAEIADTVATPEEVEAEIRHLFAALGG